MVAYTPIAKHPEKLLPPVSPPEYSPDNLPQATKASTGPTIHSPQKAQSYFYYIYDHLCISSPEISLFELSTDPTECASALPRQSIQVPQPKEAPVGAPEPFGLSHSRVRGFPSIHAYEEYTLCIAQLVMLYCIKSYLYSMMLCYFVV